MPSKPPGIDLHLYCHGLGDCHLLHVSESKGGGKWIMIDCGIHTSMKGGTNLIRTVVEDVRAQTGGKLDAIVGTHEHWDHISAFHPGQNLFTDFNAIGDIWLAWTESGSIEATQLDKYKRLAMSTLADARVAMPKSPGFAELKVELGGVLGFMGFDDPGGEPLSEDASLVAAFGMEGDRVRAARDRLAKLGTPQYLNPGDVIEVTDQVRCYVLAPPHNTNFGHLDDKALTYNAAASAPLALGLKNALAINKSTEGFTAEDDPLSPFDGDEGVPLHKVRERDGFLLEHYGNEPWRMIDHDWLMPAADLALQLDNKTNNTSLVLAFEIIESRHVLIFAADAQIGNWKTWAGVEFPQKHDHPATTGKDLLERAVFYKVGHHGSRNATMSINGLELMNKLEIAFNPTHREMAKKVGWEEIPAEGLNAELRRRTSNRLIESDQLQNFPAQQFVAGGALGTPVTIRTAIGSDGGPNVDCVECRII